MKWYVKISGDPSILVGLASINNVSSAITKKGDEYILQVDEFSNCTTSSEIKELAIQYIDILNGILFLQDNIPSAIKLDSIYRINENGGRDIFITPEPAVIQIRGYAPTITITRASGEKIVTSPYQTVFESVTKTKSNADLIKIFEEIKNGNFEFPALYNVIDILHSVKGKGLYEWVPESKIELLKRTSQKYRHGISKYDPPAKPMKLDEAQKITRLLIQKYIAELLLTA